MSFSLLPTGQMLRPVLTKQQETIRRLLLYDNQDVNNIAKTLNISKKTVKGHLTAIYKAFKVQSKYQLLYKEYKYLSDKVK